MKTRALILISIIFLAYSCEKKEIVPPTASTQANFSYKITIERDSNDIPKAKVEFFNESINAKSYLWDFGNGQSSTDENPVTYYSEEGQYDVTLTVTSDNDLYYNKLSETKKITILFKKTIFKENFNNEDYLNNFPPTGWLNIDADNDGQAFYFDYFDGDGYILSRSWSSQTGPLNPDNWFISPQIDLTEYPTGSKIFLYYTVAPTAKTPVYRTEHYSIQISETTTDLNEFNQLFEETLQTTDAQWVFMDRYKDISAYAGKKVYIAFRHHNSTDKDRIAFSDFEVFLKF